MSCLIQFARRRRIPPQSTPAELGEVRTSLRASIRGSGARDHLNGAVFLSITARGTP
jgi:hypothetical protein